MTDRATLDNVRQVLFILNESDGFRALLDSGNDFDVERAVGLSRSQFRKVYHALSTAQLVKGDQAGLHLTEAGRKLFEG